MRALCGAIIAAGSMIGLGLVAIGIGIRYESYPYHNLSTGDIQWVYFKHLDTALMVAVLTALMGVAIGLGIAFVGLAYHHHRRHHEMLYREQTARGGGPSERITV
jgi:hypothetical protein